MKQITSLHVVRIFLLFVIFACHGEAFLPHKLSVYAGELTGFSLELLFIISGFCCTLSLLNKRNSPSTKEYFIKKVLRFYPLHVITLLLCLVLQIAQIKAVGGEIPVFDYAMQLVLDLFLLQSWTWSPDYVFAFNGVAWFLSSLAICYIATPKMLNYLKRTSIRPIILLALVVAGRFIYIEAYRHFIGTASFCFINVFPPYRFLEYFCGMTLACIYFQDSQTQIRNTNMQLLGVSLFLGAFYVIHASELVDTLAPIFIVFELLLLSSLIFYTGKISDLGATPLVSYLSAITFEFYLLHRIAMRYFLISNDWWQYMPPATTEPVKFLYFTIMLILAVGLAAAWHKVAKMRSQCLTQS